MDWDYFDMNGVGFPKKPRKPVLPSLSPTEEELDDWSRRRNTYELEWDKYQKEKKEYEKEKTKRQEEFYKYLETELKPSYMPRDLWLLVLQQGMWEADSGRAEDVYDKIDHYTDFAISAMNALDSK